ncbi:MAG: NEW3 domain-containing protein, partial [Patescibacteria group bacterium]
GITVTLDAGSYSVDEIELPGYTKSIGANCSGTISNGETKTCTITNDDISPELTVIKHVINDDGGVLTAADFQMNVTANPGPMSFPGNETGVTISIDAGSYSVDEIELAGYAKTLGNDCAGTIAVGEKKTCTITNDDKLPKIVKSAPATVIAGDQITYTLEWSVSNDTFYNKLVITDSVPAGTTFVSASNGGTESAGVVTWDLGPVGPGASGTVTMTVQVPTPEYNGTIIENSAEVCGVSEINPNGQFIADLRLPSVNYKQCDDDDATTEVISSFDVTVDKNGPLTAEPGEEIDYTVDWSVSGNSPIDSLIITDTLPVDTVFVSASDGGVENSGVITWNMGAAMPGDSGSFTVTVTLSATLENGDTVTNDSEICAWTTESVVEEGLTLICDDDSTTTKVIEPILTLDKSVDLDFANPGDTATYTVVIRNTGDADAINVVLTDTLPAGFTFVSNGTDTMTWTLGDLAAGDSTTTTYEVLVGEDVDAGFYDNLAEADADNHEKISDTVTLEVRIPIILAPEPVLVIDKTVDPSFANPGDVITYTVVVSNNGDDFAVNVVLSDTLPDDFTFVDTGTKTNVWTLGDIEPGKSVTVSYKVKVGDNVVAGFYDNIAVATADNHGPVSDTVPVEVRPVKVLADTGIGGRDYLIFTLGLGFILFGYWLHRKKDRLAINQI